MYLYIIPITSEIYFSTHRTRKSRPSYKQSVNKFSQVFAVWLIAFLPTLRDDVIRKRNDYYLAVK